MVWIILLLLIAIAGATAWFVWAWRVTTWQKRMTEKARKMVMLEVLVPKKHGQSEQGDAPKRTQELISVMEQFLTSLSGFYIRGVDGWLWRQPVFSLEIVAKKGDIRFFIGTPVEFAATVERQLLAFYADAQIDRSQEYMITEKNYAIAASQLKLTHQFILPIKTYTQVESDPLENITSSLSKMDENTRALIQILIVPTNNTWRAKSLKAVKTLQEGKMINTQVLPKWLRTVKSVTDLIGGDNKKSDQPTALNPLTQNLQKMISEKAEKTGFSTQVNILTTAPELVVAETQLSNIISAFSQYTDASGNGFRAKKAKPLKRFILSVLLRAPFGKPLTLNTEEITSIFHVPNEKIDTPGIRWLMSRNAPAAPNMPTSGSVVLGENVYRGQHRRIFMKEEDRRRHLYLIGMTGTGKSTLFNTMILQDIRNGHGVCLIDPHGDLAESVLAKLPKERVNDVIYFNPGDLERPMGLNLLEWTKPEEKDFLINEWLNIFYKLFDPNKTGMVGPQFEHWGRNASLTIMANPEGGTLIEIPRLFTDDKYREELLKYVDDPVVLAFWNQQMAKTADFHKSEMFNYFISKFGRFMTNELMRNIIGQPKSAFNFREIMDNGKILIINLSKGKIGDINANMLGMIVVAKIYSAAMARQDVPEEQRKDFFLYVDEFQNLATDTFASILSEARKYRLGLNIAHQYIGQLSEEVRNAVIGNVGTLVSYRIGVPDAEFLAPQFKPVFDESDMINIEKYHAYVKTLVDNSPMRPFSMRILQDESPSNVEMRNAVAELSRLTYGKSREEVNAMIKERAKIEDEMGADAAVDGLQPTPGVAQ